MSPSGTTARLPAEAERDVVQMDNAPERFASRITAENVGPAETGLEAIAATRTPPHRSDYLQRVLPFGTVFTGCAAKSWDVFACVVAVQELEARHHLAAEGAQSA